MPIIFKSALSSSVANDTFVDKTVDDIKTGILQLRKTAGDATKIIDAQVFINEIASVQGTNGESDPNNKTYTSEQIIANGDNRKVAIGKLDAQVKTNLDTNTSQATLISNNTRTTYSQESISASGTITKSDDVFTQVRRVIGDGAPVTANNILFGDSSGTIDGTVIIVRGINDIDTVLIPATDGLTNQWGVIQNGDALLSKYREIEYMLDSVLERWIEQRRNF